MRPKAATFFSNAALRTKSLPSPAVNHLICLDKLEHYGIRGEAFVLFNSYLTNRKQYTSLNNLASSILSVNNEVPQKSVLGPLGLSFLVYMNDFPPGTNCYTTLYADDSVLTIYR